MSDYWKRMAEARRMFPGEVDMNELSAESTAADRAREYRRGLEDAAKVCDAVAREYGANGSAAVDAGERIRALIAASPER